MTPKEFIKTRQWRRAQDELVLEVLAVCLPLLIYAVGLTVAEYGLPDQLEGMAVIAGLSHLWAVHDAMFGACILFAFGAIHGFRVEAPMPNPVHAAMRRWRLISIGGLIVSAMLSGVAVIFHPHWAFALGLSLLSLAAVTYKKVIFLKTYMGMQAAPSPD
ncbi:MAG: hypothetical protein Q8N64_00630 [Hydrogenophaga sp.]|nr:hypothetical protein [Hydrogenophaga sp.]